MEATYFLSTTNTNPRITETARLAAREPVLYELASPGQSYLSGNANRS